MLKTVGASAAYLHVMVVSMKVVVYVLEGEAQWEMLDARTHDRDMRRQQQR